MLLSIYWVMFAMSAASDPPSVTVVGKAHAAEDPNRIVCVREEETGSRLGARKRCMSAAQWEETRRLDRAAIERIQAGKREGGN